MDPVISQSLAALISAIATAVLMAAAYYWGPNQRNKHNGRDKSEEDD